MKGFDYGFGKVKGSSIVEAGGGFVCRYLSHSQGKNISKDEIDDFRENNLKIVLVWETSENRPLDGFDAGTEDANFALEELKLLGLETIIHHPVVYFACDNDFSEDDQQDINDYFKGVQIILPQHRIGVYGGYGVVNRTLNVGLCRYAWQTYAWSTVRDNTGNKVILWDNRAQLRQVQNGTPWLNGVKCDTNESVSDDFGQI